MDCNKSEALRAMEMAEQKFASQDYTGARNLALKAQQLFPALENLAQTIAVMDVHVAAQTRIGINEKDWYGILQVEPTADDAVVKKQYRKLALFLHPDKNKAMGAESAFKLIGEALQVLSDKVKRLVYDAKRGMHARANHTLSASANGVGSYRSNQVFQQQQQQQKPPYSDAGNTFNKTSQRHFPHPPQLSPEFHLFTFWTACTSCQMRYQYYRKYENQNLLCPQCRRPFIAKDLSNMQRPNVTPTWPPSAGESMMGGSQTWQANPQNPPSFKSNAHTFPNFNATNFKYFNNVATAGRSGSFQMFSGATSYMNGKGNISGDTHFMQATQQSADAEKDLLRKMKELRRSEAREQAKMKSHVVKQTQSQFKARGTSVQGNLDPFMASKETFKKHDVDSSSGDSEKDDEFWECVSLKEETDSKANARQCSNLKRSFSHNLNGSADNLQEMPSGKKVKVDVEIGAGKQDLEAMEMAKRLADLAKNAIRAKLNLQSSKPCAVNKPVSVNKPAAPNPALSQVSGKKEKIAKPKQRTHVIPDHRIDEPAKEGEVIASCSVPDADFHNFDEGREEKDVEKGQVWALYDDKEGMPKYYMKVKEICSRTPFRVSIGWFEPRKPSVEVCELLDMGFSFACGEFRMVSSQVMDTVNSFSHLVSWEKSGKGLAKIYPRQGQIWCIYKDWKVGQQVLKVGDGLVSYTVVEVRNDCSEASGASVVSLNKVDGFKTIFQLGNEEVFRVPFFELHRFSHRVPARRLKGNEAPGLSKEAWELDPAAIPSSLVYDPRSERS